MSRTPRAAIERLQANPDDPVVQKQLAEQLTGKLEDPAFRQELRALLDDLNLQVASALGADQPSHEAVGERPARTPSDPDAAEASAGTCAVRDELVPYL